MTRGVWLTAAIVVIALVASVIAGNAYVASRHAAIAEVQGPDAETVAIDYLTALADRDADAAAKLRATSYVGPQGTNPDEIVVGDAAVAAALGIDVDFEILGSDLYKVSEPEEADRANEAFVTYKATYSLTAEGKPVEATTVQGLRLHRETFNASGEKIDIPGPLSDGPVIFGNWLVSGVSPAGLGGGFSVPDGEILESTSTYPNEGDKGFRSCGMPQANFEAISSFRAEYGFIPAECFAGGGKLVVAEQADFDYVSENLTNLESEQLLDLTGLELTNEASYGPMAQIQFAAGERTFIATYLLVDPSVNVNDGDSYRIIALTARN